MRGNCPEMPDSSNGRLRNGKTITLCAQTTSTPTCAQLAGLPIGLVLDGAALLDDVGKARLIQRQQTIFQHCGVVLFERRQRFACRDELQLTAGGSEVIDLVAGRIFLDEEHRFVFCDGLGQCMVGAGGSKMRRFCDGRPPRYLFPAGVQGAQYGRQQIPGLQPDRPG